MDKMTIPGLPELTIGGVKQQMTVRILEGSRGGFVVIYEDGLAARSSWDEVLDSIAEAGADIMKVEKIKLPRHLTRYDENVRDVELDTPTSDLIKRAKERSLAGLKAVGAILVGLISAALTLVSVKIA